MVSDRSSPPVTPGPTPGPTPVRRRPRVGLRARNKQEKLARIRGAAAALFREKGFDDTTAREIAERAGVATGTVFLYVRDKRELLFLIFREDAERILVDAPGDLSRHASLVDALMDLFGPLLAFYAREPELARLFVRELFFRPSEAQEQMGALTRRLADAVHGLVAAARARGELRHDVAVSAAAAAVLAHYGFWIQSWLGLGTVPGDAVPQALRRALDLALEGLAPAETPR